MDMFLTQRELLIRLDLESIPADKALQ